jgi:hypothetical protein
MTEPTPEIAPQVAPEDFDFDAWLSDAKRPERSVTVYKRADLLGDLDALERKLEEVRNIPEEDQALGESPDGVEAQYLALLQQFHDSGLTIRVHGLNQDEMDAIGKAGKEAKETDDEVGRRLIEKALVSPKLSYEQLGNLSKSIGDAQMQKIATAYRLATLQAPEATAPFSRRPSGQGNGRG